MLGLDIPGMADSVLKARGIAKTAANYQELRGQTIREVLTKITNMILNNMTPMQGAWFQALARQDLEDDLLSHVFLCIPDFDQKLKATIAGMMR